MKNSKIKTRMIIQKLLIDNSSFAVGEFHINEFNEYGFLYDLEKNFKINPKEKNKKNNEILQDIIKVSNKKIIGRFDTKEVNHKKFISELFKNFEIQEL